MFKKSLKKISLFLFIVSQIFFLSVSPVLGAFSIPSFNSVAKKGEARYNVDREAVRDMAQSMNVGGLKSTVPELMIIFSPQNPTPGEEISAQALPMYFSNDSKTLYFTWYLKHNSEGGDDGKGNADWNNDGDVDIEDYKIEATRILAQGDWEPDLDKDGDGIDDYTSTKAWYDDQTDDDSDGYKAVSGGDNKKGMKNYCYLHDYTGGKNYEFTKTAAGDKPDITCANGMTPVCANDYTPLEMKPVQKYDICADDNEREGDNDKKNLFCEAGAKEASCHGDKVTAVCYDEKGINEELGILSEEILRHGDEKMEDSSLLGGSPPVLITESCSNFPKPQCSNNPTQDKGGECQINGARKHLFARAPGYETGDESFSKNEELFWGTNPHDPSTAGNGYSDEAVISGLAQNIFKWVYQEGDLVGVAIEGTSILTTKHADSSNMIMWAFVKNHCSANDFPKKGQTQIMAKPYPVIIDTVEADINKDCLKKYTEEEKLDAFMDPVGGAGENLEVKLSYMPDFPLNDPSGDGMGDIVSIQSIINNSTKEENELLYNWEVDICSNGTFNCSGGSWKKLANYLTKKDLLKGGVSGNGLSELKIELGINPNEPYDPDRELDPEENPKIGSSVFANNVGYIRVKVKIRENFTSGMSRQGIAMVIMKVVSSDKKMLVYKVENNKTPGGEANPSKEPHLKLADSYVGDTDPLTPICSANSEGSDLANNIFVESNVVCRVMKNEIIGIQIPDGSENYSNFNWTLDGDPLVCDKEMSESYCADNMPTNTNFFPVTKRVGESYTLTVTAIETVDPTLADSKTSGKKITIVKRFEVIEPYVKIVSEERNLSKFLGSYFDLDGESYEDRSESVFEIAAGEAAKLKADFHPAWIDIVKVGTGDAELKEWKVDGLTQEQSEECVAEGKEDCVIFENVSCENDKYDCISLPVNKKAGEAYSISFNAVYNKDLGVRRALFDLWGVIQQESGDEQLGNALILEVVAPDASNETAKGQSKIFLASLSANLPAQVIFMLRIILTGFIIIFSSGIIFSLSARREE